MNPVKNTASPHNTPRLNQRRVSVQIASALALAALTTAQVALAVPTKPDALLQIDLNRTAVVERILASWGTEVPSAQIESLKSKLMGLRADQLLAANLSGSFDGVLEVLERQSEPVKRILNTANAAPRIVEGGLAPDIQKALGDLDKDLVYTPITPCNLMDTRPDVSPVPPIVGPGLVAGYVIRNIQVTGNCAIPAGAVAVSAQFTIENLPSLGGVVFAGKSGAAGGSAVVSWSVPVTYASGASVIPISTSGQMQLQSANVTQIKVDVNGFLMPANRNGNGLRVIQTTGTLTNAPNIINGSANNLIPQFETGSTTDTVQGATVAGGGVSGTNCFDQPTGTTRSCGNEASNDRATVSGGMANRASGVDATVAGGQGNTASGSVSTTSGGFGNTASGSRSTVSGGETNTASGFQSFVGGGFSNVASGGRTVVSGGNDNTASGGTSMVPGGFGNVASGNFSFAAGNSAKTQTNAAVPVVHHGAFVWADDQLLDFNSFGANTFNARSTGGVRFVTAVDAAGLPTKTFSIEGATGDVVAPNIVTAGNKFATTTNFPGGANTKNIGDRFRDNSIIAWGRVAANGVIESVARFGLTSVARNAVGAYTVTIDVNAATGASILPTVTPELDTQPTSAATLRIASINQSSVGLNTFQVWINNGSGMPVDSNFLIIVTGR